MDNHAPRDAGKSPASTERPIRWQEGEYTVTRSNHWSAPGCHASCGILFYTDKDGKLVKVEGDKDSPYSQGALCMRCLNLPEVANDEKRIKYPMKRDPKDRGKDKWERISWDEAFDTICEKIRYYQKEYGVESIFAISGTGRETWWCTPFYVYTAFQTPNYGDGFLSGESCYNPRMSQEALMIGDMAVADCAQFHELRYDDPTWVVPKCMVIWGHNPTESQADGFFGHWVIECMKRGTELVVIEPGLTWCATRAKYWLPLRPGTDGALALAILHVVIEEDLVDHDFIDNWTYGYNELCERVKDWTPERAAEICWLDADMIRAAARFYGESHPAAIQWGLAIDQTNNTIDTAQAITCLWSITGNMDVPGGNIVARGSYNTNLFGEAAIHCVDPEKLKLRIGDQDFPFRGSGLLSSTDLPDAILKCLETEKPYKLRFAWIGGTNPLACMAQSPARIRRALRKVEFCVQLDYIMTPTVMDCADIVLPITMSDERMALRAWWAPMRAMNKATSFYEAKSDEEIGIELMNRLNPEQAPGKNLEEWYNYCLHDGAGNYCDFDYETLQKYTNLWPDYHYKKYETGELRSDGSIGFNTGSGRLELYINILSTFDLDPLPNYEEPHEGPISTPELFKKYPFVLTTGQRSIEFFHSEGHQSPSMREFHPWPRVEIHKDACDKLGIQDNDWVILENVHGSAKLRAKVIPGGMNPKVVRAEHGWWFPELDGEEPTLFGTFDCNINNLIPSCDVGPTGYGAPIKCGICSIRKCTPDEAKIGWLTKKVIEEEVF